MKKCNKCWEIKEKFRKKSRTCIDCRNAYNVAYREANKEKIREYKKKYNKKRRDAFRDFMKKIKEDAQCKDCEWTFKYYQLQFDHLPEHEKKFTISTHESWYKVTKELLEEISKCEVVCANCHAERTWIRMNNKYNNKVGDQ